MLRPEVQRHALTGGMLHRPPSHLRPPPNLHTTLLLRSALPMNTNLQHHHPISSLGAVTRPFSSSSKQQYQYHPTPESIAQVSVQRDSKAGDVGLAAVETGGPHVLEEAVRKAPWESGGAVNKKQQNGRRSSSSTSSSSPAPAPVGSSAQPSTASDISLAHGGTRDSPVQNSHADSSSGSRSVGGAAPWEVTAAADAPSPKKRRSSSGSKSISKGSGGKAAGPGSKILNRQGGSMGSGPAGPNGHQGTGAAPTAVDNPHKGLLLLIDGHSMAHRSFWAMANSKIGGLKTSQGISTSATAGFLRTITAAVRDQKPSAMAITFDDTSSFRKPMHALLSYLADEQRSGMSDDAYVDMVKGICTLLKPPAPEAAAQAAQQQLGMEVPPSAAVDVRMLPAMVAAKLSKEVAQVALTAPDEEGKGYKATRKERPMGFDEDVHNLRQLLRAMRLPVISGGGSSLEADDLLAGLASQGAAAGYEVKIFSGDQDLLQLVDDHKQISVLEPSGPQASRTAGSSAFKQLDEAGVVAKLGIPPSLVPDYKAMVGDSSDNVPGVPGVGPKNGHSLLATYGSLDGVYSNLPKISKGMRSKLEQGRRKAYLSRFLCALSDERLLNAGLHTGIFTNVDEMKLQGFQKAEVEPLLEALEMNSTIKSLPTLQALLGGEAAQPSTDPLTPHDLILSPPPLEEQSSDLSSSMAEAGSATSAVVDSQGTPNPTLPAAEADATYSTPPASDLPRGTSNLHSLAADAQVTPTPTPPFVDAQVIPTPTPPAVDAQVIPTPTPPAVDAQVIPNPTPPTAADSQETTPGGKKGRVSVGATATRQRRAVRGVPSPSPSSPSPPPSAQLAVNSLASGSPSAAPAAEGFPAQAPAEVTHTLAAPDKAADVHDTQAALETAAEVPHSPAASKTKALSAAAAVAQPAETVQVPRTAADPLPHPLGDAVKREAYIKAAVPIVSMPFRPPSEPLVAVPGSGNPYSITVGSLDAHAVESKEELRLWVAQIMQDKHAQASDPAQHIPQKGQHHLPFAHRHHLALVPHFSTRPARATKSRKKNSASTSAAPTAGSDAASSPGANNGAAEDASVFQAPTDLLPPLSGISLCWPRPPMDIHYHAEHHQSSETACYASSSSSSGSSQAPPQHTLLQAIYVPCPAAKGSASNAKEIAGSSSGGLQEEEVLEALLPLLHDPTIPKAVFEAKPLHHIALRQRAMLPSISAQPLLQGAVMDALMTAYVLGSEEATGQKCEPDKVAASHQVPKVEVLRGIQSEDAAATAIGEGAGVAQSDASRAATIQHRGVAAAAQVWCLAARLGNDLGQVTQATRDLLEETEVPLGALLAEMETLGLGIDIPGLHKLVEDVKKKQNEITGEIIQMVNWNERTVPNLQGAPHISKILFDKLGLDRKAFDWTPTGILSIAEQSLEQRQHLHPVINKIISWRKLAHLSNTVLQHLLSAADRYSNGRIFPTFQQNAAATGRLAATEPNVMAINRDDLHLVGGNLRALFVPSVPGWSLLSADYSQVELRINAHFSREPTLVEAFQRGQDVHSTNAMRLFRKKSLEEVTPKERQMAKMTVFGLVYGMGADKLAKDNNVSMAEARKFMEHFKSSMPKLNAFMERSKVKAVTQGYLDTLFGRRRRYSFQTTALAKLRGRDPNTVASVPKASRQDETTLRCAGNTPLQGTSADIIKRAMVDVHWELRARGLRARILMPIHDELLIEAPPEEHAEVEALVRRVMIAADKGLLSCPLVVDTAWGANWKEAN